MLIFLYLPVKMLYTNFDDPTTTVPGTDKCVIFSQSQQGKDSLFIISEFLAATIHEHFKLPQPYSVCLCGG